MDALELLLNRRSHPRLKAPAPSGRALDNILQAALRAPDHASLSPWRFIVCEGDGLVKLGALFEQSAIGHQKPDKEIERAPKLPLRAPMVIVAITEYKAHEKVPREEQLASTACAVMAMQMAAQAQGFNGIWRTGAYAHCPMVREALGLALEDEITGFLYLGTPMFETPEKAPLDSREFVTFWQ
ncbi:NAD(P)H nitroreductase [Alteromonas sp. C1M14]|uniref:NAD(P)H nitroreductase n=1 Tax=Alteromonas sp. C1M14 TaxID=2841567 RepID=UPI001C08F819|nr:NAD(P)H nitroreductase [Alteromonas sp. C1M14]MBU2977055.1 NAD(P)H nitroreductase [Alteromonas sp. C1M14]